MAHEIEIIDGRASFFAVGETPWHGLGTRLEAPPTTADAIRLAGLDWEVLLKPLVVAETGQEVPARATVRSSDGRILGVVGPDYRPLQNREAFGFFDPFVAAGEATLETAGSLREGKRVFVLARIRRDPIPIVDRADDTIARYVLLSNGHDGTLAVRVGFTPVRVVCANTLAMAHEDGASQLLRVRHTAGVVATLDAIRGAMDLADRRFVASAEQYRTLATRDIAPADLKKYVKVVFGGDPDDGGDDGGGTSAPPSDGENPDDETPGAPDREARAEGPGARLYQRILPIFEAGRGNDLPGVRGTWWAAYNALTEYLSHHRGESQDRRVDSMWFGQGAALNRRALRVAIQMAA